MKLAEILKRENVTAAELSRGTGIAQNTISNIIKRDSRLSLEYAARIAEFLKIDILELRR